MNFIKGNGMVLGAEVKEISSEGSKWLGAKALCSGTLKLREASETIEP